MTVMKNFSFLRHIWKICLAVFALVAFQTMTQSCSKMPINSDLDGKWQVMEVVEDGELVEFPHGKRYYYNFYLHVCQLAEEYGYIQDFTANMTYSDGRLTLDFPHVKNGEVPASGLENLRFWGIPTLGEVTFKITHLTSSSLVMTDGSYTVRCRKF